MAEETRALQVREETRPARVERARRILAPAVDIIETHDDILILADMPGVNQDNVEVTLEKNILTIRGTVQSHAPQGYNLDYAEYEGGDYERTFTLTEDIDREKIEALMKQGVLHLRLPKAGPARVRRIPVKAV
ncbi:Hsp20/alpha crystallin family protein [uncultured Thermanaerothrix sp.]|uniref:Hsp20/alpha crystallin family protein n=1 Tax=uncultured Thermanaerothrix sp. TaxID=1195149 RepID=UPI00260FA2CA|nr:Hsp20/alpha crystallin family protein [uncultured Thermanaerothrix sp.]